MADSDGDGGGDLTREQIVDQVAARMAGEGTPEFTARTIAEIYATMYEFRSLIDGIQSGIGGKGIMGLVGAMSGRKR
jgi:hypothetical protein